MEKLIATVAKSETEDVCVCLTEYHGRHFLDLRVFTVDLASGQREPTSRGFSLDIGQLDDLIQGLREADEAIEDAGLRIPVDEVADDGSESLASMMRKAAALRATRASDPPPLLSRSRKRPASRELPPGREPSRAKPEPEVVPTGDVALLVEADELQEAEETTDAPVRAEQGLARVIESLKMVQQHIGGR